MGGGTNAVLLLVGTAVFDGYTAATEQDLQYMKAQRILGVFDDCRARSVL